jgi:hypothetical protein
MNAFTPSVLLLSAVFIAPVWAEKETVFESAEAANTLVEVYSSEGCSSCPPAEAWTGRLATNPDLWKKIVPVAFHVDYWDGLGWPDRFASATNTQRQRNYAQGWGTGSVYTPGFIVNGREWKGWFQSESLPAPSSQPVGKLRLQISPDQKVTATFVPAQLSAKGYRIELACLGMHLLSDVKRGENSGRKLEHNFISLHLASSKKVGAGETVSLDIPPAIWLQTAALSAWVYSADSREVLQATGGWVKL